MATALLPLDHGSYSQLPPSHAPLARYQLVELPTRGDDSAQRQQPQVMGDMGPPPRPLQPVSSGPCSCHECIDGGTQKHVQLGGPLVEECDSASTRRFRSTGEMSEMAPSPCPPLPKPENETQAGSPPLPRKAARVSQACDNCRLIKAKCDWEKPCRACKDRGVACVYKPQNPKREGWETVSDEVRRLERLIVADRRRFNKALSGIERAIRGGHGTGTETQLSEEDDEATGELSDQSSPPPALAPTGLLARPPIHNMIARHLEQQEMDGEFPDGSRTTVLKLLESFKEHILEIHPIIPLGKLNDLVVAFLDQTDPRPAASKKRKRPPEAPPRNINSCLVFAVLALGKICLHKGELPDADVVDARLTVPGLEYLVHATDILGNQTAGDALTGIWANTLVGLYYGQLMRPLESFKYISVANRGLLRTIKPLLPWIEEGVETEEENQLVAAFWTCMQLEEDLLTEMPLIPSGLLDCEKNMPYPSRVVLSNHGFEPRICESYLAQVCLRKHLNMIHGVISKDAKPNTNVGRTLKEVMKQLGSKFEFEESDPPATDILSAILRVKYWEAQFLAFQPFVKNFLSMSRQGVASSDVRTTEADSNIMGYAQLGISALIESTRAFHGLPENERPIVTNMFATTRAQLENLLILTECYKSDLLRPYVDGDTLRRLIRRVVSTFKLISGGTSDLKRSLSILNALDEQLFSHD